MQHRYVYAVLCLAALAVRTAGAESAPFPTNGLAIGYWPLGYEMRSSLYSDDFMTDAFEHMSDDPAFANTFGSINGPSWFLTGQSDRYGIFDDMVRAGRNVVRRTIEDGFREAFVDQLSYERIVEAFLGDTWLAHAIEPFIADSLGNTAEQQLDLVSLSPSTVSLAQTFEWRDDSAFSRHFGFRDAGVYGQFGLGRQYDYAGLGQRHVVDLDVRARLLFSSFDRAGRLRMIKFEARAVFPLPGNCQIVLGGSLYPEEYLDRTAFDTIHYGPSASERFEYLIGPKDRRVGIAWIGRFDGPRSHGIAIGLSAPMDAWNRHMRHS